MNARTRLAALTLLVLTFACAGVQPVQEAPHGQAGSTSRDPRPETPVIAPGPGH